MPSEVEQELKAWQQPKVTREETTGGMGLILAAIIDNIETRRAEMELQDDAMIAESIETLIKRSLILVNGIKRNARSARLAGFLERSATLYEMSDFLVNSTNNRYDLRDKINRFGEALQGDMNVNKLLTNKAKDDLARIDELKADHIES